jgi:hypothetical protein
VVEFYLIRLASASRLMVRPLVTDFQGIHEDLTPFLHNGNLLTQETSVYTWDAANRLIAVSGQL